VCFALVVVLGIASGQTAVAIGMAAAPFVSLMVVPWFFARRERDPPLDRLAVKETEGGLTLRRGAGFAIAVFAVMVAEQTLLNASVLTVEGTSPDPELAGVVFSVLLIARAPLQLFQAVQGSLLPHLAGLEVTAGRDEFRRAIRVTVLAIAAFAAVVAAGLFAVGPWVVGTLFHIDQPLARGGLALVGLGMGFHLMAGTLNQAALAREQAGAAAIAWLVSAALFVAFMLSPVVDDQLLRAEAGYFGATALLCALLAVVYRRPRPAVAM
jgi:O-antigen/teichoic acid export membrane protein